MRLSNSNAHVLRYAEFHGLKTKRRNDGEIVLPVGPSKKNGEAWYAGKDIWAVHVRTPVPGALCGRILRAVEATIHMMDGELEARVHECDLLTLLECSRLTRPRRKRRMTLTPERRQALRDHMKEINRRKMCADVETEAASAQPCALDTSVT